MTPLAMSGPVEEIGIVLLAALAALAVLPRVTRVRAAGMLGVVALTPALLIAYLWDRPQIESLRDRPAVLLALIVVGGAVVLGLAWLFTKRPALAPLLCIAAVPFRIPIESGGETANLLLPLYVV